MLHSARSWCLKTIAVQQLITVHDHLASSCASVLPVIRAKGLVLQGTRYLIAGGAGGSVGCAVAYPLDLVKTKLAADMSKTTPRYRGLIDCAAQILKREGVRGLYKGLGATLLQVTPTLAVNFTTYEMSKAFMMGLLRLAPARQVSAAPSRAGAPSAQCTQQYEQQPAAPPGGSVPPVSPEATEDVVSMERSQHPWPSEQDSAVNAARHDASTGNAAESSSPRQQQQLQQRRRWQRRRKGDIAGASGREDEAAEHAEQELHGAMHAQSRGFADTRGARSLPSAAESTARRGAERDSCSGSDGGRLRHHNAVSTQALPSELDGRSEAQKAFWAKAAVSLVAGSASGMVSSTLTFPLDVIRRNLQAKDGLPESYMQVRPAALHTRNCCSLRRLNPQQARHTFCVPPLLNIIPITHMAEWDFDALLAACAGFNLCVQDVCICVLNLCVSCVCASRRW